MGSKCYRIYKKTFKKNNQPNKKPIKKPNNLKQDWSRLLHTIKESSGFGQEKKDTEMQMQKLG